MNTKVSDRECMNEKACKAQLDRQGGVSDGDRQILQLTSAIQLLAHSPPFCSIILSLILMCFSSFLSLFSQNRASIDYACLSFPNSTRHSISLTRQIIRISSLTLPIPSDVDRPQWQCGNQKMSSRQIIACSVPYIR